MDRAPSVVRVVAAARAYEVRVGAGLLGAAGEALAPHAPPGPALIVTDDRVGPLYLDAVKRGLAAAGFAPRERVLPAGEASKTLAVVETVLRDLAALGADRGTPVVALGGGMVNDLAGFAASVWLRGAPWLALPTSLLAQVDASVGGKTGVNLPEGKNLAGAFHPPVAVLADPLALSTLPAREFRSGLAEVAKIALTLRPDLLADIDAAPARFADPADAEASARAVLACVEAKAAVVTRDEREAGPRRVLNFGHTAGHAIEAAAGFGPVRHGEAVAVGICAALSLSVRRGLLQAEEEARGRRLLESLGLPVSLSDLPVMVAREALRPFLARDKKRRAGHLSLVLLASIGRPVIVEDGREGELLAAIP